jgi:hypothetical protein
MKFIVGLLVGISLAVGALQIPQVRGRVVEFAGLVQPSTTDRNASVVDQNETEKFNMAPNPQPLLPETNPLATKTRNRSSKLIDSQQVEEGTPDVFSVSTSQAISAGIAEDSILELPENSFAREAEGSLLQAAEGSSPRAAEGSLLRAAEGSLLRAAEGSFQPVWIPFRSEVSARGFATRLQRQVLTEFLVVKIGPGKYEVGFHYNSDKERTDILHNINSLTGLESRLATRTAPGLITDLAERGRAE